MKKLVTLIPTKGKTKEQITQGLKKRLEEKGIKIAK